MSRRLSFLFALILILLAAGLRLWDITTLPAGFSADEITNIRITEAVRGGQIGVFYDLGDDGREGLYHISLAMITTVIGHGNLGYRLVSVGAGLISLALVYAVGLRLFGRLAALSAVALMSFGMYPVLLSRQITPAAFLPMLTGAVLLTLISALPAYRRRRVRGANTTIFAALGLFVGLGVYIHPAGLMVALGALVFVIYINRFSTTVVSQRRTRYIRFALLMMLIIIVPYLTSSIRQTEINGLARLFDGDAFTLRNIGDSLAAVILIGDAKPLNNLPQRPLIDPVSIALMLLAFGYSLRRWHRPRYMILPLMILTLLPVAIFSTPDADFGAYAALLPLLYLMAGFGISLVIYLLPQRIMVVGVIALLGLVGVNFVWTASDIWVRWQESPEVQQAYHAELGQLAHFIDTNHDNSMVVCGWEPEQAPNSAELTDAQLIDLMLNRDARNVRFTACETGMVLTNGGDEELVILPDPMVIERAHPQIQRWLENGAYISGDAIPDNRILSIDVMNELADQLGAFTVTTPVSYAPETGQTDEFGPPVTFGGNVTFMGYASDDEGAYAPGSILTLVTYWRVDGLVPRDLRLFTHVLADPGAAPVANTDTISTQARLLQNRDVIVQVTYVPLPDTIPPGEYRVSIGAYQDTSLQRLDVLRDGDPFGTRIFLFTINVADPDSSTEDGES